MIREYQPAVVTLDIFLPDMQGWRVLDRHEGRPVDAAHPRLRRVHGRRARPGAQLRGDRLHRQAADLARVRRQGDRESAHVPRAGRAAGRGADAGGARPRARSIDRLSVANVRVFAAESGEHACRDPRARKASIASSCSSGSRRCQAGAWSSRCSSSAQWRGSCRSCCYGQPDAYTAARWKRRRRHLRAARGALGRAAARLRLLLPAPQCGLDVARRAPGAGGAALRRTAS